MGDRKLLECERSRRLSRLREKLEACERDFSLNADLFAVLASETRLKILALLNCVGELTVCELASLLDISPAAVSQHLARMRECRLVACRRKGTTAYYRNISWPLPLRPPMLEEEEDLSGEREGAGVDPEEDRW